MRSSGRSEFVEHADQRVQDLRTVEARTQATDTVEFAAATLSGSKSLFLRYQKAHRSPSGDLMTSAPFLGLRKRRI